MASGDLNEYIIRDLVDRGAPIDSFGVGTGLSTSRDDPRNEWSLQISGCKGACHTKKMIRKKRVEVIT